MTADHDDLIAEVRARQLGDYVVRVPVFGVIEFGLHVDPKLHAYAMF